MKRKQNETLADDFARLQTAEQTNQLVLERMWHDWNLNDEYVECTVPDIETAKAYCQARHIRMCSYGGMPNLLDREYTSEEVDEYYKKEKMYNDMCLDMRHQIIVGENGKKGLRDVCGNVLIEPQFDDIPELYSCFKVWSDGATCHEIPVIINDLYYLYDTRERKIISKGYSRIFRYFGAYITYFVIVENWKKGILYRGKEVLPPIADEIYDMPDPDGSIPYLKNGKAGLVEFDTCIDAIFDRFVIRSEDYTQVMLNGKWGWIDQNGKFTTKKSKAAYGSWYDYSK